MAELGLRCPATRVGIVLLFFPNHQAHSSAKGSRPPSRSIQCPKCRRPRIWPGWQETYLCGYGMPQPAGEDQWIRATDNHW